jgi:Tfp pilus assembly protein FimT
MFEIILVLAIIVMAGAFIAPAASKFLEHQRLARSSEIVRTGMMQARLEAMRTGRPQVFRCTQGSPTIAIEPWIDPADAIEASDMAGMVGAGGNAPVTVSTAQGRTIELESGVVCQSVQIDTTMRDSLIVTAVASAGTVAPTQGSQTSIEGIAPAPPIVFYPDGTATDAIVVVSGDAGKVQMRLRGMTGDVTRVAGN